MRKRILLVATLCVALIGGTFAQTNLDFETWGPAGASSSDPIGWGTLNTDAFGGPNSTFQETTDPGGGLSSARLVTTAGYAAILGIDTVGGFVSLGGDLLTDLVGGVAYTQFPTSIDLVFKSNVAPGDTGVFVATLSHWDGVQSVTDGQAFMIFAGPAVNVWTPLNLPFQYFTTDTPDTLQIIATSSQAIFFGSPLAIPGSEIQIDDIVINAGTPPCNTPVAAFTSSSSNLLANFTDGSVTTGNAVYAWTFGDGIGTSVLQNPSYTYLAAGTYNVCLTVIDSCGTNQLCQTITVTSGGCTTPTASFTAIPGGLSVVFADGSTTTGIVTYSWDFGDGVGTSFLQNPLYTYASAGTYNVCLTVNDDCGSNTACQSLVVTGGGGCPAPVSGFTNTTSGLTATFTNTSTGSGLITYAWDFGDGNISTASDPTNTYTVAGSYNVCLTSSDSCGFDIECQMITVTGGGGCTLTVAATSTDESSAGMGDGTAAAAASNGTAPFSYLWSNGQTTALITGLAAGSYTVVATDGNGCTATATVTVQSGSCQLSVTIAITNETTVGSNDGTATAIVTNGTAPYNYSWSTGATTSSISGLAPGVYTCTVIDVNACNSGATGVVQAFQCAITGTVTSTDETSLGAGDGTASVAASGGTTPYAYLWSNLATTSSISALMPGIYDVTVTDANGCTYTASAAVNPGGLGCNMTAAIAGTDESQSGANDGTATVTVTGGTVPLTVIWDNGATTTTISGLAPGDYTVVITDAVGCFATATYTVVAGQIVGVFEQQAPEIVVNVYPNPASAMINFEITGAERGVLYVFDFAGRKVREIAVDQTLTEIYTGDLKNGMYFYQLIGSESDKIGSGKFLIQR